MGEEEVEETVRGSTSGEEGAVSSEKVMENRRFPKAKGSWTGEGDRVMGEGAKEGMVDGDERKRGNEEEGI